MASSSPPVHRRPLGAPRRPTPVKTLRRHHSNVRPADGAERLDGSGRSPLPSAAFLSLRRPLPPRATPHLPEHRESHPFFHGTGERASGQPLSGGSFPHIVRFPRTRARTPRASALASTRPPCRPKEQDPPPVLRHAFEQTLDLGSLAGLERLFGQDTSPSGVDR